MARSFYLLQSASHTDAWRLVYYSETMKSAEANAEATDSPRLSIHIEGANNVTITAPTSCSLYVAGTPQRRFEGFPSAGSASSACGRNRCTSICMEVFGLEIPLHADPPSPASMSARLEEAFPDTPPDEIEPFSDDELQGPGGHIEKDFFMKKMPEELPISLRGLGGRLRSLRMTSGAERLEIAYHAGRRDAALLRGENWESTSQNFRVARAPSMYIVLRGGQAGTRYPVRATTFAKYKMHVFKDKHHAKPKVRFADTVSHAFYSVVEARAYCEGAGLPGLI